MRLTGSVKSFPIPYYFASKTIILASKKPVGFCCIFFPVHLNTASLSSTQTVLLVVHWADLRYGPRGPGQRLLVLPQAGPPHRHPPTSPLHQNIHAHTAPRCLTYPTPPAVAVGWSTAPLHHRLHHPLTEVAVEMPHLPQARKHLLHLPHPLTAERNPFHQHLEEAQPRPAT